ncbi:MAG TPA: hypothetical protein HA364_09660 [Thermoplasmata archaeon]|nr:hypothetical protein [Thermoplasmata archaeon]
MDMMRRLSFPVGMFRPGAQCVVGAALGLVSIFLPWLGLDFYQYHPPFSSLYQSTLIGPSLNLLEVVTYMFGAVTVFCAIYAVGAIMSMLTPLGGVLQAIGLSGFIYGFALSGGEYRVALFERVSDITYGSMPAFVSVEATLSLGVGYYIAMLSTFIVLWSPSAAVRAVREGPLVHNRIAALAWNTSRPR